MSDPRPALPLLHAPGFVAVRVDTGTTLEPWGDGVGDLPIQGQTVAQWQEEAVGALGGRLVEQAPESGPYVVFTDRCWFTTEALRALLSTGPGRMHVDDPVWWENVGPLQEVPAPGVMELALHPGGEADWRALPTVTVELDLDDVPMQQLPEALAHVGRPVRGGAAGIHQVHHWSHLVRCGLFAILARAREASLAWTRAGWMARMALVARILWKAKSLRLDRLAAAISEVDPSAKIDPTAVIEASIIGPDAVIGPYAVVRASVIGAGARVDEHSLVQMSGIGAGARVGRQTMLTATTLMEGAMIWGGGYQASVVGREAFVAWGTVMLDMSFGKPVMVVHRDERVSSGHHFLGTAVGHRVRTGQGVRLNHGVSVPNDAVLIAPGDHLLRHWDGAPTDEGPLVVENGRPRPIRRG